MAIIFERLEVIFLRSHPLQLATANQKCHTLIINKFKQTPLILQRLHLPLYEQKFYELMPSY